MDCDLRRPMLHRHFRQQNTAGIISWFEQGARLEGDVLTNPELGIVKLGENLWLLTSGGRSKSPTELLENPVFPQLLERLKKQFDLVVIDSPPMGAVTDAMLIAERADEVDLRLPVQPRLPQAHQALHPGAARGEERGPRHRPERPVAPADRVLLELPLLPELQEVLRRADLRPRIVRADAALSVPSADVRPQAARRPDRRPGPLSRSSSPRRPARPGVPAPADRLRGRDRPRARRLVPRGRPPHRPRRPGRKDPAPPREVRARATRIMAGQVTPRRLFDGLQARPQGGADPASPSSAATPRRSSARWPRRSRPSGSGCWTRGRSSTTSWPSAGCMTGGKFPIDKDVPRARRPHRARMRAPRHRPGLRRPQGHRPRRRGVRGDGRDAAPRRRPQGGRGAVREDGQGPPGLPLRRPLLRDEDAGDDARIAACGPPRWRPAGSSCSTSRPCWKRRARGESRCSDLRNAPGN